MKRWPLFVAILLTGAIALWLFQRPRSLERLYERIEPGMGISEAERMLGPSAHGILRFRKAAGFKEDDTIECWDAVIRGEHIQLSLRLDEEAQVVTQVRLFKWAEPDGKIVGPVKKKILQQ